MHTTFTVGVVGAGRVGAVLSAALRAAGHTVVAAAGESDASRGRIADLLPGVAIAKPSDVARACDLLLLTVPDDMLGNVVTVLADAGGGRAPGVGDARTRSRGPLGTGPRLRGSEPAAGDGDVGRPGVAAASGGDHP